jgi:hypothetical protein
MAKSTITPTPIAKSLEVLAAAKMLKDGFRTTVVSSELKMSSGRVSDIRNELLASGENEINSQKVGGALPSVSTFLRKHRLLDATAFVKCLLARFEIESGGACILNTPVETDLIVDSHRDYLSFMSPFGRPTAIELSNRLSLNESWVLARDVSMNLIRIYSCKTCQNDRIVHEDQRINTECPYC